MAEEAGFEPARACDPCRFSKPVPSTTWVFLRARTIIPIELIFVIIFLCLKVEKIVLFSFHYFEDENLSERIFQKNIEIRIEIVNF